MHKFLKILFVALALFAYSRAEATHIRAGDISMTRVQDTDPSILTYRILLNLYRDGGSNIEFEGELNFGDGVKQTVRAVRRADIAPQIEWWQVEAIHTYPSDGIYGVSYFEQNRNDGIRNMNNSVNTPFFIESAFFISHVFGLNDSPTLTMPPIDEANIGQRFIHNPGAFDAQGDSLSYRITICRQSRGVNVENYRFPNESPFSVAKEDGTTPPVFSINPITGDLIWDAPNQPGEYNVAFFVDEWRDGIKIGAVNRDMQIIVRNTPNKRPNLILPADTCIVAGMLMKDTIVGIDPDGDQVLLTAQQGGLFGLRAPSQAATFALLGLQPPNGMEKGLFEWQTNCNDVQEQPYYVVFKAEDNRPPGSRLADIQTWRIKVVGPPPLNLKAVPDQVVPSVSLSWDPYSCGNAESMIIWRRQNSLEVPLDTCNTDVNGYERIAEVPIGTASYVDDEIKRGITYCYRIQASFPWPKNGESLRSEEACVFIEAFAPYMLNVSIDTAAGGTSNNAGRIALKWTRDQLPSSFPEPITYTLERAQGEQGRAYQIVAANLTDTSFVFDSGLNTESQAYNYRVKVFSNGSLVDSSQAASSVRLTATPQPGNVKLSWDFMVPWSNREADFPMHYVYREVEGKFRLIDSVNVLEEGFSYVDSGEFDGKPLDETKEYCYYVATYGSYPDSVDADFPLVNFSQIACALIQDSIPPCPPLLTLAPFDCAPLQIPLPDQTSDCDGITYSNSLSWVLTTADTCSNEDVVGFNLYFSPFSAEADSFKLLAGGLTDSTFLHSDLLSVAGCYAVTSVDDFGNESAFSNIACIEENCPFYELPNVFTPNGDGRNDTFVPYRCPRFVKDVRFSVKNRWGKEIYASSGNINLDWAGVDSNGKPLPDGAYYYVAEVVFYGFSPQGNTKTVTGVVHLMR